MTAPSGRSRPKRPFWLHQVAEYLLGGVLVAQGLQSPTPTLPAVAGALVMVNAAIVRGPLAAFRLVDRQVHRLLDLVVIGAVVAMAVQPWADVEGSTRVIMAAIAAVMAVVWSQSSFADRSRRQPVDASGGRSTELGRLAGRAVGDTINTARRLKKR